jgi:4-amino-4-deoxy-L-arabinose transferase-like glycosyltransferase
MSTSEPARTSLRFLAVLGVIIVVGLIVRIAYLAELEHSDFANMLSLDSRFYRELAISILAGDKLPPGALTFNPLYPLFLVVAFKLFGKTLLIPRLVQAALGLATVALVFFAGGRLAEGPWKGRPSVAATAGAAGIMAILYAPFVLYEGIIVSTSIEVFLLTASFAVALIVDHDMQGLRPVKIAGRPVPRRLSAFALGALLGAGALARPNLFLLLIVALPLWFLARHRRKGRGLEPAIACVLGSLVFLLPPIAYNARSTGKLVPVTAHGGINFYIGNRPGTRGTYDPPEDMRADMRGLIEDARARAETDVGRSLSDADVSDYYFRQGLSAIKSDPAGWLRLLGRKLLLFWNGTEIPDLPNAFFYQRAAPILKLLCLPFAVVASLGLVGLVVLARNGRNRSIVFLFVGTGLVSVLLFYVNARYRLPLVPILMLAAAVFVAWAAREVSRKRWRSLLLMAMLTTGMLVVSTRTIVRVNRSAAYTFLGNYYVENRQEKAGEEAFVEAYRLDPDRVESMVNYARVLARRGELEASAAIYERAFGLMPSFPRLAAEYGSVLEKLGKRDEARSLYMQELSSTRTRERVLACQLLANLALSEGNRDEAARWVKMALDMAPGDPNLTDMLNWLEQRR